MIEIVKSSRHQRIVGNFGEHLVCNWLSRSGFEVCIIDHTGMDLIAYRPDAKQRLGISVKARTRILGKDTESVYVFREGDQKKLEAACKAFDCEAWIAVYVECADRADLFLTSLKNYKKKYRSKEKRVIDAWKMTAEQKLVYWRDRKVKHIGIEFKARIGGPQ